MNNSEFLTALFGADAGRAHVTDFLYDPGGIPKDQHLAAWKGDYFKDYTFERGSNQYFTISTFHADEHGVARRRKALYRSTPVIVLDDVREKLSVVEASKLPAPTWILETSKGSEQWGYLLDSPCTNRGMVENLLDGLVESGLAPQGKDPGMKGVTRYVRLPDGSNSKASKLVNGYPYKCRLLKWEPFTRTTMSKLALPFNVDLNRLRREARVDGAADIDGHPLLTVPDIINIKAIRSAGRFDITCPWVDEHTDADDSGAAVFTNSDGSVGFKCHHGACQERTGKHLLRMIDQEEPGFTMRLSNWQALRAFADVADVNFMDTPPPAPVVSFMDPPSFVSDLPDPVGVIVDGGGIDMLMGELRKHHSSSPESRRTAEMVLKVIDSMPKIEQKPLLDQVCDLMDWRKSDLKEILTDLRKQWYGERASSADFYDDAVYVRELNQFYGFKSKIFFTPDAFQNSYSHEDAEAKKIALQDGRVRKVDRINYAPKKPKIFVDGDTVCANTWSEESQSYGRQGDVTWWLAHFDEMGWTSHRKHIVQWMAYTLRHPDMKINHILLMGSREGCGKDFLLYPLAKAMGDNHTVISGEELLSDFNDYLLSTKYLHINEAELGDRHEAQAVSNRLKPLAAAPPEVLRVNQKGIKPIKVTNIVNGSMTTNSQMPLRLNGPSRRFYAVWSDLNPLDEHDEMLPRWREYWSEKWTWMKSKGGWENVVWHLLNEVDLSDFSPESAPPMTDFMRDIKEQSKSPMQQTLEGFMKKRVGAFGQDMATALELSETLRAGDLVLPGYMFANSKLFTPVRVGQLLKELGNTRQVRINSIEGALRLWMLNDNMTYLNMSGKELYREWQDQVIKVRQKAVITAVIN